MKIPLRLFLEAIQEYIGLIAIITKAPNPKSNGRISSFCAAISFLIGLNMYQELKTRKNKTEARTELILNPEKILLEVYFESI